jgi:hypothetical protein
MMMRAGRWVTWVVKNSPQLLRTVPRDPVGAWLWAQEELTDRREHRRPQCSYEGDPYWENRLHGLIDAAWPCQHTLEFSVLWPRILAPFEANGTQIGRGAFAGWGDGEPGMLRAIWCLVRHLRPTNIVETGVARGFTSRVILEALERNQSGHLWSIDLPPVQAPELHAQIGAAVEDRLRPRWTFVRGTSRQRLPPLLRKLGYIDLFVHDSRHTEENVRFELSSAWPALRPGGAVVADDIDMNWGFDGFRRTIPDQPSLHCYAEPLSPDMKRFEAKGLFGIALKRGASA